MLGDEEHTLMDVRFLPRHDVSATLKKLMKEHSRFYWAVAWGSDNPALSELLHHKSKIGKFVVGTHFYQTPPTFLEQFQSLKAARVVPPDGLTFHPKTYLFVSDDRSAALIGSVNFTNAAMESNVESCCLIEGSSGERLFRDHCCPAKISRGDPNPLKTSTMTYGRSWNDLN
jgi:HKD family nuclease